MGLEKGLSLLEIDIHDEQVTLSIAQTAPAITHLDRADRTRLRQSLALDELVNRQTSLISLLPHLPSRLLFLSLLVPILTIGLVGGWTVNFISLITVSGVLRTHLGQYVLFCFLVGTFWFIWLVRCWYYLMIPMDESRRFRFSCFSSTTQCLVYPTIGYSIYAVVQLTQGGSKNEYSRLVVIATILNVAITVAGCAFLIMHHYFRHANPRIFLRRICSV